MPIKFRCQHCQQFLGISRSKAGTITDCPTCGRTIRVPNLDGEVEELPQPELNLNDSDLVSALGKLASLEALSTGTPQPSNRPSGDDHASEQAHGGDGASEKAEQDVVPPRTPPVSPTRPEPIVLEPLAAPVPVVIPPPPAAPAPTSPSVNGPSPREGAAPVGAITVSDENSRTASDEHVERISDQHNAAVAADSPSPQPTGAQENHLSALDELARKLPAGQLQAEPSSSGRLPRSRGTSWIMVAFGVVAGVGLGFALGRVTSAPSAVESGEGTNTGGVVAKEPVEGEGIADAEFANFRPAISGRITYVSASGDSHPDSAARVLVIPETREGTAKLSVEAFRSGASPTDQRIAVASLRAAGGDYAIADPDGRYTISLPKVGAYQLLVLSHYQPRDEQDLIEPGVINLLQQYFDRPPQLIGATAYHLSRFSFRGEGVSARDLSFERL
ncbi:MAG: hypothetical protein R3C01_16030 [Planctomycetaceae bacterium]